MGGIRFVGGWVIIIDSIHDPSLAISFLVGLLYVFTFGDTLENLTGADGKGERARSSQHERTSRRRAQL